MQKLKKRLTASSTWVAGTDLTPVDLPREGLITEVTIRSAITVTLTAAAYADALRRYLQNIKIEGNGKTFLGLSGLQTSRLLSLANEYQFGSAFVASPIPDVGSTVFRHLLKFHPGSNPRDPFDLSAAIPAQALSSLQAKLTTTANNVLDSGGNITAGTFNYEVCQVVDYEYPVAPGVVRRGVPPGLMVPVGSTYSFAHAANASDFSQDIDIPAGNWLRSIWMLVQDDSATVPSRADDEVAGVAIKLPKSNNKLIEQNWYELKQAAACRFGVAGITQEAALGALATTRPGFFANQGTPAGWAMIDLREYGHPLYGLDLRGYQSGDLKLGLTIENYASGDDTLIYWDQLESVDPALVGK